ncbi:MAG: tetratricopeptide repeat protein [Candidatus Latescibacteria bacterium]|nr:tetratricopeptide repeat protein [Candidatus Latescibacterota bacterium]
MGVNNISMCKLPVKRLIHILSPALWLLASWGIFSACSPSDPGPTPAQRQARWHNNQGVVYMDQHNYTRGRGEFARAVELDPAFAGGHTNLGIAHYSLGQYDSALVALQTALQHDTDHIHAHYTLGLIYNAQGKEHERARTAFERVVQADPDDPLAQYYLGQVEAKLGRSEVAISHFQRAIALDPYNVSSYYAMANQYRKMGRQDQWKQTLGAFNELSQQGYEGVSSSYQGQGKYAEATTDPGYSNPSQDDRAGPFEFIPEDALSSSAPAYTAAADYDRDGDLDLVLGQPQAPRLYRNDDGVFTPLDGLFPAGSTGLHALWLDRDGDDHLDLLLSGAKSQWLASDSSGHWTLHNGPETVSQHSVAADVDHDGDLDILTLGTQDPYLLSNDGNGLFTDITQSAGLAADGPMRRALFTDFDNDRDIDFFLVGQTALHLYTNNRDGSFTDIAADLGLGTTAPIDIYVEDFDQDGYMDLVLLQNDGSLTLYTNAAGTSFTAGSPVELAINQPKRLAAGDLDNDGDIDLVVLGANGIQLVPYHRDSLQPEPTLLRQGQTTNQVLVADFDDDGLADLLADGQLLRNQSPSGNWLKIVLQGLNSNHGGIGTKVEVKTANRLQKRELRGGADDAGVVLFGLAQTDSVEFVRILWPSGVRQTELAAPADQTLELTELNRKGTSCPILYAWDGEQYRFVTDILGGGIIGYLIAPGQYYTPDTDEYVPLGPIAPKDGRYVVQIANQLEEIIYLDAVHLLAVDHPTQVEIYPNERLLSAPPYPEARLYPVADLRPPVGAWDQDGQPILDRLVAQDDDWYDDFALTDIHGYAQPHSIVLDLGDLRTNDHPVLLAYGWVDYAHSTSNWAAHQQGLALSPPRLEVVGRNGEWVEVLPDMGTPAGLPKHMLVDLQGLFPGDDYRLRISTNAALYWDQFLVGQATDAVLSTQRLQAASADLHWRGYPQHTAIKGTFAFRYHYDRLDLESDWGTHGGSFTRHGAVEELLATVDDMYAIMFHGDEITVEFAALPPPAPGLQRTFLLYADGFGKDMDFHSAHSLTVEPLPFHGMSTYPYPPTQTYPQDETHLSYLLDYNTRRIKGRFE